jgi:hypothetical protein
LFSLDARWTAKKVLKAREVTVVQGTAMRRKAQTLFYTNSTWQLGAVWLVGPITLPWTPENDSLMKEGSATAVTFFTPNKNDPSAKIALSVNGITLKYGTPVHAPANVEQNPPPLSPQQPPPQGQPITSPAPSNQEKFCPYCGTNNPGEYKFCAKCQKQLP